VKIPSQIQGYCSMHYAISPKPNFYLRGDYFLQQATESKYSVHFILSWKKAKHETKLLLQYKTV